MIEGSPPWDWEQQQLSKGATVVKMHVSDQSPFVGRKQNTEKLQILISSVVYFKFRLLKRVNYFISKLFVIKVLNL